MKLLFENWQKYLVEQSEGDLAGKTIVLLGDSQMIGGKDRDYQHQAKVFGLPPKYDFKAREAWSRGQHMGSYLESLLRARGANVVRIAKGGTGSKFWNRKLSEPSALDYIKSLNPDQIILSLGENDSWRAGYGRNEKRMAEFFHNNTAPLMKKLTSVSPNVTWFGPAHRYQSVSPGKKRESIMRGRNLTDKYLSQIATNSNVNYISMLDWATKSQKLQGLKPKQIRYDKVHYRGEPAKAYAEELNARISAKLSDEMDYGPPTQEMLPHEN